MNTLATVANLVIERNRLLEAHQAGQPCGLCTEDGYFRQWPESAQWQPVTLERTH